jgi:predicted membrane-bound spermidine synthase
LPQNNLNKRLFLPLVLATFTASGFAGLIYESIWSHYLRLFLGHAAYAQTLVLAIFMGGMALGAWLASRFSARLADPLLAYALIEALIGVGSLAFHDVFVAVRGAVHDFKWLTGAALILPQSLLLGMTFPLMSAGLLRLRPQRSGYAIAMLYFTNSLGAAAGVLASGFYFIERVGLPGALLAAAIVNLGVAAAVMLLPGRIPTPRPQVAAAKEMPLSMLLLAVAALTGMSSFMYEIGWIRMLSLVLGSSTHAFELMLSAFILGIAFGGLWVRRRIDAAPDAVRLLGWVQVAMGLAALATLPVYASSFAVMQQAMGMLTPSEQGYVAFNFVSHALCIAVMFPAAFCAGMTLPLITHALLRAGAGERAIGRVYAANTAGAIAGVLAAVHVGLPLLGLKGLIAAGAAIDLGLGLLLLRGAGAWRLGGAASLSAAALLAAVFVVRLDAHEMASGVFRHGVLLDKRRNQVLFQEDGKTATVSVTGNSQQRSLRTNGKPDGSVRFDAAPDADEVTMTLLGALPQFLAPEARRVANIGFGTGISSHVLLASERIEALDTIEIEPAMVRAAVHFRPFNARALEDPRSHLHYEDAKTFFSTRRFQYDVIVSEPSNPWVSGVAGLFSTEFYRDASSYLRDGGLFVQWVQIYEMTPALLATVVAALEPHFSDYELWQANDGDLLIVAARGGRVPRPDASAFGNARLRAALERFHLRSLDDLLLHRIAGRDAIGPYFAMFGAQANSDYFPVLEQKAPEARFRQQRADEVLLLMRAGLPLLELFDRPGALPDAARISGTERAWLPRARLAGQARAAAGFLHSGDARLLSGLSAAFASDQILLRAALLECRVQATPAVLRAALADLAFLVNQHLDREQGQALWRRLEGSPCMPRLAITERELLRLFAAVASRDPREIAPAARAVLGTAASREHDVAALALAPYMAATLLNGDAAGARLAFRDHRARLNYSPEAEAVFRFLLGQADRNGQSAGNPGQADPLAMRK